MFVYLILLVVFTVPFSAVAFKYYGKKLFMVTLYTFPLGVFWDWLAASYLHIWTWNPQYIVGIRFIGLPLEEYLFILLLPWSLLGTITFFNWLLARYSEDNEKQEELPPRNIEFHGTF